MKTRVKLYNHNSVKNNTNTNHRCYDVYDIRAPYTIPPPSPSTRKIYPSNTPPSPPTDEEMTATTATAATLTRTAHESVRRAYTPNYIDAEAVLHAIRLNQRVPLSPQCIHRLATYVVQAWEVDPSVARVVELVDVINHLMSATALSAQQGLDDDLLKQYCRNVSALPTICPSVALLIAMRYIDRLKKKYASIRGAMGCSHRLVVVAYMMAAKYIHASLRLVTGAGDDDDVQQQQQQRPPSPPPSASGSPTASNRNEDEADLPHTRLSTERSTLNKPGLELPASPPLSPSASPIKQQEPSPETSRRALRALRMEIEFLHFLSYDLSCAEPISLVHWVHQLDDDLQQDHQYTSADEGDDEMTDNDSLS